jgi:nucleoside-diphosphate kinase
MIEKTLVLLKPDAVKRALVGEIVHRFEKVGFKIIALKLVYPTKDLAKKHYPVTDEWYRAVGNKTLKDCEKYNLDPIKNIGTKDPVEIGKIVHKLNIDFLTSGPVVAIVLEGVHAVEIVRKMVGETVPALAAPGTIRGDYSSISAVYSNIKKRSIYNLVHASGSKEEAEREINHWFSKEELHSYKVAHEDHTR